MGKRKKTDKSLGRDPFEDMNGMGWGEDELLPEPDQEEAEPELAPEQAAAEVEPPTEEEEAGSAPDETEAELVLSEAEEATPEQAVEPPAEEEAVEAAPDETEAEVETVEAAADAEVEEVEPPAEGEAASAPPPSRVLDELMDTIDEEVEEAFGPGAMADLAPVEAVGAAGEEQHVIFTLAGTEYAVPIANVTEIGRPLDVTPVPNVPDWMLGVANLRGDIISIVDLRAFLGMEQTGSVASRMVVAQARREDMTTGLIVDRVSEIRYLAMDRIGAPTASIEDQVAPYLRGVYEHDGRLLVLLNLDQLLLSPEMRQFEPV